MHAVRYERWGPAEVLQVAEVPAPQPGDGEVAVRIAAASLNPLDWKLREGALRWVPNCAGPPRITGCDFAGVVAALGAGVTGWRVGARVFGMLSPFGRQGSCAGQCTIDARRIAAVPDNVDLEAAACLPVATGEAVQALADAARLAAGQRLLVVGASGGVGHFALQIAKRAGAWVAAACGAENLEFVAAQGADEAIDYRAGDLAALGARFDVVFDVAGALDWRRAQRLLVKGGLYLGTGGSTRAAIGTGVGRWLAPVAGGTRAANVMLAADAAAWQRLAVLAQRGVLTPHIEARIGLAHVRDAQDAMQRGRPLHSMRPLRGKIVVLPTL